MSEDRAVNAAAAWAMEVEFQPQHLPLGELTLPRAPLIHLWYLDLGDLWQSLSSALGDETAEKQDSEDMTVAQLRFARRFYLRMLLGAYLGVAGKDVSLVRGDRGKPVLDRAEHGDALHFSLSKSGHRLLIGISGANEIGVDLELINRKPRNTATLARRFFTQEEASSIIALDGAARDAAFIRTWACKEAVAKASGHGIANRFSRFALHAAEDCPPSVTFDEDHPDQGWQLALLRPERDYLAAVAVLQPSLQVEAFRI